MYFACNVRLGIRNRVTGSLSCLSLGLSFGDGMQTGVAGGDPGFELLRALKEERTVFDVNWDWG
ncbi:hypothetical protein CMV30_15250 [Nibricoccus aquaticus]|uniref:Uncharacterized protein n=1 Tax=Nibricoccus aquaticus TaxID=2576891 RepID=A0A290QM63_9BACT|nr:hypothetical protein CMV30_15250 [Nibricoccus aquaticus]